MQKYIYEGPVTMFNKCIINRWTAETWAVTKEKAKSNFIFQFKKSAGLVPGSKIELPGKIREV